MDKITEGKIRKIVHETIKKQHGGNPPKLLEYSRVNKIGDSISFGNKMIYVYNDDRNEMSPHFHYFDAEKNFNIEVRIEGVLDNPVIIKSDPRAGVPINRLNTWDGLSKERKTLIKWLPEISKRNRALTNYMLLILLWNANNPDNEIEVQEDEI
jgi:hypothetical protein